MNVDTSIAGEIGSIIDYIRRSHREPRHGSRADHLGTLGMTHLREVLKRLEALRARSRRRRATASQWRGSA